LIFKCDCSGDHPLPLDIAAYVGYFSFNYASEPL